MERQYIIAHADKAVLKISGLQVKGLDAGQLETTLAEKLNTTVRVIGVTGDNIEMDVYGLEPDQIRYNESSIIEALSLSEGITATDLIMMSCSEKIVRVDWDNIPPHTPCAAERWGPVR